MFNPFRFGQRVEPPLTYFEHYEQVAKDVARLKLTRMDLIHVASSNISGGVELQYQWSEVLSFRDADILDSRARAYIACAIYDAAIMAKLSCRPGPRHGQRPSWRIEGEGIPISLVQAGFDVSEKTCFMSIGVIIRGADIRRSEREAHDMKLAHGFGARFQTIVI